VAVVDVEEPAGLWREAADRAAVPLLGQ
jgi:hypothetical protein